MLNLIIISENQADLSQISIYAHIYTVLYQPSENFNPAGYGISA